MTHYVLVKLYEKITRLRREATQRPIYIIDRGMPRFVIMSVDHYDHIRGETSDLDEVIESCNDSHMPALVDVAQRYGADIDDAIDRALEIIDRAPDVPPDPGDELPPSDPVADSGKTDGNVETE